MTEVTGNLIDLAFDGKFDLIIHGCNTQKGRTCFGKGLALEVKNRIPEAYEAHMNFPKPQLGLFSLAEAHGFTIINAYTQIWYGKPYSIHYHHNRYRNDTSFDRYRAIRDVLRRLNEVFVGKSIGIPLIGCGLAGGSWNFVKGIIEDELTDMGVTIVHFNG